MTEFTLEDFAARTDALRQEIRKAVHGQDGAIDQLLVSVFSRGHCLLEGPPGTAKTLLARSFAAAMALDFGRIQFTPDLMPGDVLGANLFDFSANAFRLVKGPVFTDILLADEINRAPPKTQAALLQAMQEGIVTIDGQDLKLGEHFHVIATQNPIEQQGTYPLPEAQNDRFLFKIVLDFPERDAELEILRRHAAQPLDFAGRTAGISPVMTADQLKAAQSLMRKSSPTSSTWCGKPGTIRISARARRRVPQMPSRVRCGLPPRWMAGTMPFPMMSATFSCRPCAIESCSDRPPKSRAGRRMTC